MSLESGRVIGVEARQQILHVEGRLPDVLVACVGGGSNAMGLFHPFIEDDGVQMIGVEAAGDGVESGRHAAALSAWWWPPTTNASFWPAARTTWRRC